MVDRYFLQLILKVFILKYLFIYSENLILKVNKVEPCKLQCFITGYLYFVTPCKFLTYVILKVYASLFNVQSTAPILKKLHSCALLTHFTLKKGKYIYIVRSIYKRTNIVCKSVSKLCFCLCNLISL